MLLKKHIPITQVESFSVSNLGYERQNNEDNFLINGQYMDEVMVDSGADGKNICVSGGTVSDEGKTMFAICDGMGGESLGEVASLMCAMQLAKLFNNTTDNCHKAVDDEIKAINSMIQQKAVQTGCFRIGTTLALAYIINGALYCVNVGDSRIYLQRNGKLKQISVDHTEVQYYVSAKVLSKEDARTHPMRHSLTQHLGMDGKALRPYRSKPINLSSGDRLLLCSDGVTEMLDDNIISEILDTALNAENAAMTLVEQALRNGGIDNTTAITVFVK